MFYYAYCFFLSLLFVNSDGPVHKKEKHAIYSSTLAEEIVSVSLHSTQSNGVLCTSMYAGNDGTESCYVHDTILACFFMLESLLRYIIYQLSTHCIPNYCYITIASKYN